MFTGWKVSPRFASLLPPGGWARPRGRPGWWSRRSAARPGCKGASRTLRRYPGGAVVSVRLRDRTYAEVVDDMIDGVLATNRVERRVAAPFAPGVPARAGRGRHRPDRGAREGGGEAAYPGRPGPGGGTADAGGLNPPVPSGAYRFESCSGHRQGVSPRGARSSRSTPARSAARRRAWSSPGPVGP